MPACVIVKHANPCGCALASDVDEAYELALASDPVSAYGGVVALNRRVEEPLARALAGQFVEVLIAPGYSDEALEALRAKPATRILEDTERRGPTPGERDYRRVPGGLLVQDADTEIDEREGMMVVTQRAPTRLAGATSSSPGGSSSTWSRTRSCSPRTSRRSGSGGGQTSRVDAVRIAVEKAQEHRHDLAGAALASDAFFPFPDGPRLALDAGVTGIIQPGGSKRDSDVVAAVEQAKGAMVFTSRRHFRH